MLFPLLIGSLGLFFLARSVVKPESRVVTSTGGKMPETSPGSGFSLAALLNLIARAEANNGYDSYYAGSRVRPSRPVSQMTIAQIQDWQRRSVAAGSPSSAVGRYQFIASTLNGLIAEMGIAPNAVFNAALQDRMATQLLMRRGLQSFVNGALSAASFASNLAREWAGLPKDHTNVSYYHGTAGNRANVAFADVLRTLGA